MAATFRIVTPCRNAEHLLGETIESVLAQSAFAAGRARLEYRIVDGASTDRTAEIARAYAREGVTVVSEPDGGMYDALAKGLDGADGCVCAYLNAGDLYSKQAFDTVLEVFQSHAVRWLTGMEVAYNDRGQVIHVALPYRYRARLFQCGAYGTLLPFLQQESTFWDGSLNRQIDFDRLRRFRYAGDYYLWHTFSRCEPLAIAQAYLGGFRVHGGQLSAAHMDDYRAEMGSLCRRPTLADRAVALWDRVVWSAPVRVKKALNRRALFRYDTRLRAWV
jgi:glycosyltransferase involved in cell wall biosynthesis